MGELSKLPNIGEKVEEQLNAVGIFTYDDLKKLGAEKFLRGAQSVQISEVKNVSVSLLRQVGRAFPQFVGAVCGRGESCS